MNKNIPLIALMMTISLMNKAQTVVDYDGNIYNTVTIGSQIWMKENLNVTHYRNGISIPNVTNTTTWKTLTSGASCDYENTPANSAIYGRLYNWYAATDTNNICPLDWHIPTDSEWNIFEKFLDNTVDTNAIGWAGTDIGGKLKETGFVHWYNPNTGATNISEFTALPGGYRNLYGSFMYYKNYGYWWASKPGDTVNIWRRNLNYDNSQISRANYLSTYKVSGFSCRCIMDDVVTKTKEVNSKNQILLFPNPATDRITVSQNNTEDLNFCIYNILGECVLQNILIGASNNIDISFLKNGIYFIKISGADFSVQQRLIKNE
jgi:uncharacterized protein (TIGR02145 family)